MNTIIERDINSIKINADLRVLTKNRKVIEQIKTSVKLAGKLFNSIVTDEDINLLDGYCRLISMKELGYTTIPTVVYNTTNPLMKKYVEISLNLDRRHFTYLQHGQMLTEGKSIYEKLNSNSKNTHDNETDSFTKNISKNTDKSQKIVQETIKVYKDLRNIDNEYILPLLHSLENRFHFKHTKTELKSIPNMDSEKFEKFVSILRDIDKKNIKRTSNMRLKEILINLDSYNNKQIVTEDEMLSFNIYKYCLNKPKYKDLLDSIDIDLVKYKNTKIKINNDFKKLIKFLETK